MVPCLALVQDSERVDSRIDLRVYIDVGANVGEKAADFYIHAVSSSCSLRRLSH